MRRLVEQTVERKLDKKVVVLGWDGASFDLAQRWIDEGRLPHLAELRAIGAWGPLRSTMPPVSAPAWASFVTGNNPGRHGIYYFKEHVAGTYESRLVNGADRRGKPLWRMLNQQGKKMGAVNLIMTYPPEPLDGFLVSGMDTPSEESVFTYPAGLKAELNGHLGHYIVEWPLEEEARNRRYDQLWKKIETKLENRIRAVHYLIASQEWDVFAVNFRATDDVQHHFWRFMDPTHPQHDSKLADIFGDCILRVYQRLDRVVGEIRARLKPHDVLIVMSDHGFGPTSDKVLYLNNWLAEKGWLKYRKGAGAPSRLRSLALGSLWEFLRKVTPQRVKDGVEKLLPDVYGKIRYPAAHFLIDWSHTRAYADEYQESIWINLAGREPAGIVQSGEEYESLRREIVGALHALIDPHTGEAAIEAAARREECYHGDEVHRAPDIVVLTRQDPYYRVRPSHTSPDLRSIHTMSRTELEHEYLPSGVHRLEGMFYAAGPEIAAGKMVEGLEITDLAPTILFLAGCMVPRDLDGKVAEGIFRDAVSVQYFDDDGEDSRGEPDAGSYDEDEERLITQRLRGLGYLD